MDPGPEMVDKVLRNMFGSSEVRVTYEAPPPQPAPPWHAWACVSACCVMLVASAFLAMLWLDAKSDIRQVENDVKAIRAYINAGKVPVKSDAQSTIKK